MCWLLVQFRRSCSLSGITEPPNLSFRPSGCGLPQPEAEESLFKFGIQAKIAARLGATTHEKARPGGISLCINRREDQGAWRLARQDARESARNHTSGRP